MDMGIGSSSTAAAGSGTAAAAGGEGQEGEEEDDMAGYADLASYEESALAAGALEDEVGVSVGVGGRGVLLGFVEALAPFFCFFGSCGCAAPNLHPYPILNTQTNAPKKNRPSSPPRAPAGAPNHHPNKRNNNPPPSRTSGPRSPPHLHWHPQEQGAAC